MIKLNLLLTFVVVVAFGFFTSCAKTTNTPVSSNTPQLSATIAGASWSGGAPSSSDNGTTIIIASTSGNDRFSISLNSATLPGTFQVDQSGLYTIQYIKNSNTAYNATSGTITVTSYANKLIKGTFQASASNLSNPSDVIAITNGSFTAQL